MRATMMPLLRLCLLALLPLACEAARAQAPSADAERWQREARAVTITRDDWGIAHVRGKSDADAVFGVAYAQAEDDFNRVETNYINAMGGSRKPKAKVAIWQDLRMKLFVDPATLQQMYAQSPTGCRR